MRQRIFYINKEGFLAAFKDAFFDVFTVENCKKAFKAAGLVPFNPAEVLDRLEVRLRTPPDTPWQSKTPSNILEFGSQSKFVHDSIIKSPNTAQTALAQLVKGNKIVMHKNALIKTQLAEVEDQLAIITKRKSRKRKRIQTGNTLEYGEAADQITAEASSTAVQSKRANRRGGSGGSNQAPTTQRHCGKCGETGHNAQTCEKDAAENSESDGSN